MLGWLEYIEFHYITPFVVLYGEIHEADLHLPVYQALASITRIYKVMDSTGAMSSLHRWSTIRDDSDNVHQVSLARQFLVTHFKDAQ